MDLSHPVRSIIPSLEGEVFRVLARTVTPLSGSRIAELADSGSNAGIRVALNRMLEHGTITASSAGSAILYTANRDHVLWSAIEASVRAADGTFDNLTERISALARRRAEARREPGVTISIYGSVARGDSTLQSDIDMVVLFPAPDLTDVDEGLIDDLRVWVPRWTGNSCNIYALSRERLSELVATGDPIVDSWRSEAVTVAGPDLASLISHHDDRHRPVR